MAALKTTDLEQDTDDEAKADRRAAHDFLAEIRTRIATQPLPYQHGVEKAALESLVKLFELARATMKAHPGCREFASRTTRMLNLDLRPFTAKWHRAANSGLLASRDGSNAFRAELDELRPQLRAFARDLLEMAYGPGSEEDPTTPNVISKEEIDELFLPVLYGLDEDPGSDDLARIVQMNDDERSEVLRRRLSYRLSSSENPREDAIGLALSGGGIRSATFCLGVVQVLAERKLMPDVDYMSTVSGGGYTGSFISSLIGDGCEFENVAAPSGPDTEQVRHVRQHARYLSVVDLKRRWLMISGAVAGLLLNLSAPFAAISSLALIFILMAGAIGLGSFAPLIEFLFIISGVGTIFALAFYGWNLESSLDWRRHSLVFLGVCTAGTAFLGIWWAAEKGFERFEELLRSQWPISGSVALALLASPAAARFLPIFKSDNFRKKALTLALYGAGLIVPLLLLVSFYSLRAFGTHTERHGANTVVSINPVAFSALAIATIIIGLYAVRRLNVNLTSPHKLYRDQLADTFIWQGRSKMPVELNTMNQSGKAPYHLINAAVNLPSSKSVKLLDRKVDFFLMSKYWTGSSAVGYQPTANWRIPAAIDLATAMAISGAAASPHMGLATRPTVSALMSLLNLRLGFWMPKATDTIDTNPPRAGFLCLMKEMTGLGMSEKETWLNVSDGGHIENMGIYELLRRRCKFIICVDGEADPLSTFAGQLTLVRHAQIDLGVTMDPRLDDVRVDQTSRFSRTHAQLFRISYPTGKDGKPAGTGLMLYLKLSLTGDEAELLKRYRTLNPDFPHQSTIDQFYDEEQFEVYRRLGVHVAEGLFAPVLMENSDPNDIRSWFKKLAANLLEPAHARPATGEAADIAAAPTQSVT